MELVVFPIKNFDPAARETDLPGLIAAINSAGSGSFPVGGNRFWHGGVHVSVPAQGGLTKASRR